MVKNIPIVLLMLLRAICFAGGVSQSGEQPDGWRNPNQSPKDSMLIFCDANAKDLYLIKRNGAKLLRIGEGIGSSYGASWSRDGRYIAFKQFVKISNDAFYQVPCLFDLENERLIPLHDPTPLVGVPTVSNDGIVAFTIGRALVISDAAGHVLNQIEIGFYTNLSPISPNGKWVVYNDKDDQLWLLDLSNETATKITDGPDGYFEPQWSKTHFEIVAKTLTGDMAIIDLANHHQHRVENVNRVCWSPDGEWLVFSRVNAIETVRVLNIDLWAIKRDGSKLHQVTHTKAWEDDPSFSDDGRMLFFAERQNGLLNQIEVERNPNELILRNPRGLDIDASSVQDVGFHPNVVADVIVEQAANFTMPYIHQVYDTPDWFNGHWACGATAAMMCLAYYSVLPSWPVTVSWPSRHSSQYGRYICERYEFNGITYNISSPDPDGTAAYGGYGYIVRNNWRDTKGYMAQYARQHGLTSAVDWSPSREKAIQDIDKFMPFVLLNSLTESGHYISVTGYQNEATTLVVNDPYGNKNFGYMNYSGKNVKYDWPGYTNGHSSLNTVHCFIYMRNNLADLATMFEALADSVTVGDSLQVIGQIINLGKVGTGSFNAKVVLSTDVKFDSSDVVLREFEFPELVARDTTGISVTVSIPDSLTSNLYAIALCADMQGTVIELTEENNVDFDKVILRGYPDVFNMWPGNGRVVGDSRPKITAVYRDRGSGIARDHVRFYLDGSDLTQFADVKSTNLNYIPAEPLDAGEHIVEISVPNNLGLVTRRSWHFTIESQTAIIGNTIEKNFAYHLGSNYPNPFNASTNFEYTIPAKTSVHLSIITLTGEIVREFNLGEQSAGNHELVWDGRDDRGYDVASGLYFYQMRSDKFLKTMRMLLLR